MELPKLNDDQASRLRKAAAAKNYNNAAALARAMGQKEVTVRAAMNGTRPLTHRTAEKFGIFLGVIPQWLLYGTGPMTSGSATSSTNSPDSSHQKHSSPANSNAVNLSDVPEELGQHVRPAAPLKTGVKDVPIRGYAKGGNGGIFIDQGARLGFAYRPNMLEDVEDAYAIEIWDRSMEPALKHGHLALIHPSKTPLPGDDVVVVLRDGSAMVKTLIKRTEKYVEFEQYNPRERFKIEREKIKLIHLIVDSPRVRV